jgi:hypothetical protein
MSDLIDRQAAIDALNKLKIYRPLDSDRYVISDCLNKIVNLPSAQLEIIYCKDCKHYREYDSEYVENAVVVQCMADRYPISETIPDGWFCAGAERKDDE